MTNGFNFKTHKLHAEGAKAPMKTVIKTPSGNNNIWHLPIYNPSKDGNSVPVRAGADDHLKILSKGNLT